MMVRVMADDDRYREVAELARQQLAQHVELTTELVAIQKELERRVSLAKKRRGNTWGRRNSF